MSLENAIGKIQARLPGLSPVLSAKPSSRYLSSGASSSESVAYAQQDTPPPRSQARHMQAHDEPTSHTSHTPQSTTRTDHLTHPVHTQAPLPSSPTRRPPPVPQPSESQTRDRSSLASVASTATVRPLPQPGADRSSISVDPPPSHRDSRVTSSSLKRSSLTLLTIDNYVTLINLLRHEQAARKELAEEIHALRSEVIALRPLAHSPLGTKYRTWVDNGNGNGDDIETQGAPGIGSERRWEEFEEFRSGQPINEQQARSHRHASRSSGRSGQQIIRLRDAREDLRSTAEEAMAVHQITTGPGQLNTVIATKVGTVTGRTSPSSTGSGESWGNAVYVTPLEERRFEQEIFGFETGLGEGGAF